MSEWIDVPAKAHPPATAEVLRHRDEVISELYSGIQDSVDATTERDVLLARYLAEATTSHPEVVAQRSDWLRQELTLAASRLERSETHNGQADRYLREILAICESVVQVTPPEFCESVLSIVQIVVTTEDSMFRQRGLTLLASISAEAPTHLDSHLPELVEHTRLDSDRQVVAEIFGHVIPEQSAPDPEYVGLLLEWIGAQSEQLRVAAADALHEVSIEHPTLVSDSVEEIGEALRPGQSRSDYFLVLVLLEVADLRPEAVFEAAMPVFETDQATGARNLADLMLYLNLTHAAPELAISEIDWFFSRLMEGSEEASNIGTQASILLAEHAPGVYRDRLDTVVELMEAVDDDIRERLIAALCIADQEIGLEIPDREADRLSSFLKSDDATVRGSMAILLQNVSVQVEWNLDSDQIQAISTAIDTQIDPESRTEEVLKTVQTDAERTVGQLSPSETRLSGIPLTNLELFRGAPATETITRAKTLAERGSPSVLSLLPKLLEFIETGNNFLLGYCISVLREISMRYPRELADEIPLLVGALEDGPRAIIADGLMVIANVIEAGGRALSTQSMETFDGVIDLLLAIVRDSDSSRQHRFQAALTLRRLSKQLPEAFEGWVGELVETIDGKYPSESFLLGLALVEITLSNPYLLRPHSEELVDALYTMPKSPVPEEEMTLPPGSENKAMETLSEMNQRFAENNDMTWPTFAALVSTAQVVPEIVLDSRVRIIEMLEEGDEINKSHVSHLLRQITMVNPDIMQEFAPELGRLVSTDHDLQTRRVAADLLQMIADDRPEYVADQSPALVTVLEAEGEDEMVDDELIGSCLSTLAQTVDRLPEEKYPDQDLIANLAQANTSFTESAIRILSIIGPDDIQRLRSHRETLESTCSDAMSQETQLASIQALMHVGSTVGTR